MRRPLALLVPVLALAIAGCCGSKKPEPSRWDKPADAPKTDSPKGDDKKTEPAKPAEKPVEGGALNKFFPGDVDGHKRVFTQEKSGFAEAKLTKDGKEVAMLSISDTAANADAVAKFKAATDKVSGFPLITVGKNQSSVLVKDRWQVKVSSQSLDEKARKDWLGKFDLSGLSKLLPERKGRIPMSEKPIYRLIEELPQDGLTVTLLGALDYVVPGEWANITSFEGLINNVTGEDDQSLIQTIGERANALYDDPEQGYQRAIWLFSSIDSVDKLGGAAALANKLGDKFSFLSFLDSITPEADTTQAIDAGIKFAGELATFCLVNGIPGDSVGDFASALVNYGKEDIMRIAAWLSFDCLLPLGPDFLQKIMDGIDSASEEHFGSSSLFQKVAQFLPGGIGDQQRLIKGNIEACAGYLSEFSSNKGLSQDGVFESIRHYIDVGDNGLDYVAAAIDMGTNYFEHTGTQSVARRLISRAYGEI